MSAKVIYLDNNTKIELHNNYIIKTINKFDIQGFNGIANEAKIQQIGHSLGISPKVYKVTNNGIIMEYINGHTLDEYLKLTNSTISRNQLKIKIRQVLNLMYDAGIDHRDLTGKNIMINDKNEIKIIDYGHAIHNNGPIDKKKRDFAILKNF